MDISPLRLAQLLIPRTPQILRTIVLNKLSLSENSDKQDVQTEVTVGIIKSLIGASAKPLKEIQDGSIKDPGIKGKMWIAKATIPAPGTDVKELVLQGIKILGTGTEQFILPEPSDITGEWTGYRNCQQNTPRQNISEQEHYEEMMKEVTSDLTVLYFHGGAYFMMDPASHRNTTSVLARKTGGRCFSVRYRLAPQNPFPTQLLDGLNAYLYLLAPPKGSFHQPVPANKIVFAGDSAGGNLSTVLLLLLTTLKKSGINTINFHGQEVPIDIPAGIAVNSPWMDISRSLPTIHKNARFDYLDPPSATGVPSHNPPPDEIWPANPPRAEIFCSATALMHPLVAPMLATPEMWKGAPPAFMCCGNEGLEDEVTVTARRMHQAGASVHFEGYEGMPHCFAMIFPKTLAGQDCFNKWAQFMVDAVQGRVQRKDTGQWMKAFSKPATFTDVDLATMGVPDEEVTSSVKRTMDMALQREEEELRDWSHESRARL